MSNGENEIFLDEDIENTYEQLTKVVNAKNDIKSFITSKTEKIKRNEIKIEELESDLHNARMKITSNPILKELNTISEENAIDQRKLAESIYTELPDLSSRLDMHEENYSKFNGDYTQAEKLHSEVEDKLNKITNRLSACKKIWEDKITEAVRNYEDYISRQTLESKQNLSVLSDNLAQQKDISKSLSYEIESRKVLLQNVSEINERNSEVLLDISNFAKGNDDNSSLVAKEIELNNDIAELTEKSSDLSNKVNELKEKLNFYQISRMEIQEQIDKQKLVLKKKESHFLNQKLENQIAALKEELDYLEQNVEKQKSFASCIDSESEVCVIEINKTIEEIKTLKNTSEQQVQEQKTILENNKVLRDNIKELSSEISKILENKNKEELSITLYAEKEKTLQDEMNKIVENLNATQLVIADLNEKISKTQNAIDEKVPETPLYEEVEKENSILDVKIRRYVKAIEICKKNKAASMRKKRDLNDFSDSSQDSMVIPSKKNRS